MVMQSQSYGNFLRKKYRDVLCCEGPHLDLVASFSASMRECNDVALSRGTVRRRRRRLGTLLDLLGGGVAGRIRDALTVMKSGGLALVVLLAAQ